METKLINAKEIGARIRELRQSKNKTQTFFADMVYITPSYLSLIEDGQRVPNIEVLAQIARVTDVSLDYLIYGTPSDTSQNHFTYVRLSEDYSEEKMAKALRLAEYYLELDKPENN